MLDIDEQAVVADGENILPPPPIPANTEGMLVWRCYPRSLRHIEVLEIKTCIYFFELPHHLSWKLSLMTALLNLSSISPCTTAQMCMSSNVKFKGL